jgi:hypothetical protein
MTISDIKNISPKFLIPFSILTLAWPVVVWSHRPSVSFAYVAVVLALFSYAVWDSRRLRRERAAAGESIPRIRN